MEAKLNVDKLKGTLGALSILNNEARAKIFLMILDTEDNDKEINMSEINEQLQKKFKIKMSKQSCITSIRELEKLNLVKLDKIKDSKGQRINVKPTKDGRKMEKLLYVIKDSFV